MPALHPRAEAVGEISTLLGRGSEFEGKLTFEGTVRIDGKLSGEIFSDDVLVVGEGAEVHAEIDVGEIIVQGTIVGNVRAKRAVEVHAPGRIRGDITTPSLQIDKGVTFEGRCYMENVTDGTLRRRDPAASIASPIVSVPAKEGSKDPVLFKDKDKDLPIVQPPKK